MTTIDFITELFCRVDDPMRSVRKHAQAVRWPSEVVTLGLLHALQSSVLALADARLSCPVPAPSRAYPFVSPVQDPQAWTFMFLAPPTLWGTVDSVGIELRHPLREGRSPRPIGRKGVSNHRWRVADKLGWVIHHLGGITGHLRTPMTRGFIRSWRWFSGTW